jgi:predicted permease
MRILQQIARRLGFRDQNAELDAEIQAHLALETKQRLDRGESPESAGISARKDFGSIALAKEQARDAWGRVWLEQLLRDAGLAARSLRKSPGFTVAVMLTAGLGLGSVTAMYTMVNALILRTLPVLQPEELLEIRRVTPQSPISGHSVPLYEDLAAHATTFSNSFLWFGGGVSNITANGTTRLGSIDGVLGDYYGTMGIQPALGRAFTAEDHGRGDSGPRPVAVISHTVWQRDYHGTPDILGRTIRIETTDFTIIGVHPKGFHSMYVDIEADALVPLETQFATREEMRERQRLYYTMVVRRNAGTSIAAVQAEFDARWPQAREAWRPESQNDAQRKDYDAARIEVRSIATGMSFVRNRLQKHLEILFATAVVMLLLVCLNVGNLVMARTTARLQEQSVRLALGASRARLLQLILIECALLGMLAAAVALALSLWLTRVMTAYVWAGFVDLAVNLAPDYAVLAFLFAITMFAILVFSVLPAFTLTRIHAAEALRERNRIGIANRRLGAGALIAVQVALSIALLVGAALFWQGLREGLRASEALAAKPLYSVQVFPTPGRQFETPDTAYYEQLRQALLESPGVLEMSLSNFSPLMRNDTSTQVVARSGTVPERTLAAVYDYVAPRYLQTLDIRLVEGRDFAVTDSDHTPRVALVSATLARKLFGGNALGERIQTGSGSRVAEAQIVGIFADTLLQNPRTPDPIAVFLCTYQSPVARRQPRLLVKSTLSQTALEGVAGKALARFGRQYPLFLRSMRYQQAETMREERMMLELAGFAASFALLLACIGLYGLLSYTIARRAAEIGLRAALGASRSRIALWLARRSALVVLPGILLGAALTAGGLRWTTELLQGLAVSPVLAILFGSLAILVAAGVATLLPALRASRIHPADVLRNP